ncbi:hypothetical protein [Neisseria sp. Ec49-e6-T10]|uniref:hypothetical protein n=1 Tax=Neisseria sp. Ec49-e6-T10 TaxID=3140744 RepID=UPI003EC022AF
MKTYYLLKIVNKVIDGKEYLVRDAGRLYISDIKDGSTVVLDRVEAETWREAKIKLGY